ncbi:MAG TPA: isoaspartyl peptidase/L-asparaginase [Candidatus Udaeobacter sp.]|nr:isoaspartyl peptidase/L-asparaginase [Candidatus Udaeobacter sp.]
MKLAGVFGVNCFFGFMLFSAAACVLAEEPARSLTGAAEKRPENQPNMETQKIGLAIHGGAGTIEQSSMTPEREREYRAGLERALTAGYEILKRGGSSLDATEAAVRALEDDPHFNAGKGSVFTSAGTNEMDAAIMDGKTLAAGAVASLKHIKNPINLARLVMEKSGHVMMDSEGAEAFAKENGIELVDQKYFFTQDRWDALQKIKAAEKNRTSGARKRFVITDQDRHGTVGAVALDKNGDLAAATSTGGTTNKRPGRVGDTPVIGAGTYANNATCAVSATGDGEYFIRATVGQNVSALMEYRGMSLKDAAQAALDKVAKLGGTGGLIAIDHQGNVTLPFNTAGMYRGYVDPNGKLVVEIYR